MEVKVESIGVRREEDPDFSGLFIYAHATLEFQEQEGAPILVQTLISGGLGDVEGDEDYLAQIDAEQRAELVEMLNALGLSDPDGGEAAITTVHVPKSPDEQRGLAERILRTPPSNRDALHTLADALAVSVKEGVGR